MVSKPANKHTHRYKSRLKRFFKKLGPGLITGASDDDDSGIATYSQAGARFGLSTLWTALISAPLMIAIQEMCARIGIVTHKGLARVLKDNYPKSILYVVAIASAPAIVLNIGADISAVGAVSHLLLPQIPTALFSVIFTILLALILVKFSYTKIASILKWLCLALFAYFVVPFIVHTNWHQVLTSTFIPSITLSKSFILILVALFGTTISPYLFFWQASMEVEDEKHRNKHLIVNKAIIRDMKFDVRLGMILSNVVMFFIILTTGTVLFKAGITNISTVAQAAAALKPLAGNASYLLFALGIIGSGLLAIPVLAGSLAYMKSEMQDRDDSFDENFHQAPGFYMTLLIALGVGLFINFAGISPITMLIYTAVLYGLISPILIAVILHISNNHKILGKYTNNKLSNVLGVITLVIMSVSAILFILLQLI